MPVPPRGEPRELCADPGHEPSLATLADGAVCDTSSVAGQLAAFLGVSAIVIMTPGPDTALTIRNTLIGGRRAGIFTAIGVSSGQATWTLATAVGIAALLAASEPAFLAVKLVGSAYLVWLGIQAIAGAVRGDRSAREAPQRGLLSAPAACAKACSATSATILLRGRTRRGSRAPQHGLLAAPAALRQGLLSNLGNPKMAAFFPSLLPQFAGTRSRRCSRSASCSAC